MKLKEVFLEEDSNKVRLNGSVDFKGDAITLFFEYPIKYKDYINVTADPFFPVLLLPSMMYGEDLEIIPEISARLYNNSCNIQDIFTNWYPDVFQRIEVISKTHYQREKNIQNRTAQFFSLGVDSFYTLIKNKNNDLKHLIYMEGLELPLSRYSHNQEQGVIEQIGKVEKQYEVNLIHGKANFRDYFDLDWPKYYHGAGLAATALSLSNRLDSVYIPSSHSYGAHIPVGSSFVLDHYWSTEHFNIIHDGAERGRSFKVKDVVSKDPFALNHLRVCTENDGGNYNCCQCRKCISTMMVLDIIGKLDDSEAFPEKNYDSSIQCISPRDLSAFALTEDLHTLAKKHNKMDLAGKINRELMNRRHDLYGRKELSVGLLQYTLGFIRYLITKLYRRN